MSVLILNSLKEKNPITAELICQLEKIKGDFHLFNLTSQKIEPCRDCGVCNDKTPGRCIIDDDVQIVMDKWLKSDMVILVCAITCGSHDSVMKKFLERILVLKLPLYRVYKGEIHHRNRYDHNPVLAGIGLGKTENQQEEETFKFLINRNATNLFIDDCRTATLNSGSDTNEISQKISNIFKEPTE